MRQSLYRFTNLFDTSRRLILVSLSLFMLTTAAVAFGKIDPDAHRSDLQPEKIHQTTLNEIAKALRYGHYRKRQVDDEFSSELLDAYLKRLDRNRLYFLSDDIKGFEHYRSLLDDAIRARNLDSAFAVFNRYQLRSEERLNYLLSTLESGLEALDFERDELIETDRSQSPWANSTEELDNLWRKRLKSTLLNLKLGGKNLEESQALLLKRYRNQLNRLYQTNADDAFQVYANTITSLYGPHTQYFSPRRSENFNIDMRLSLEGIGAVLQNEDENTKVVRLIPGGPAAKGGALAPADIIVGVAQDQEEMIDVVGWRLDEVVDLIRGPKGSRVRLEVIPAGSEANQTRIISITRNKVKLEEQAASKAMLDLQRNGVSRRVGVITVPTFYIDFNAMREGDSDYRSTTRDVRHLLETLKREGAEGIIIDLRNNGGGSLKEAIELAGLFIPQGPVVQIKDTWGRIRVEFDKDPTYFDIPLAVIVNRLSASASEIFAGAIKDYDRGLIIGSDTYGKGTVQALHPLEHGQLKLTQAAFYRVSGPSTQHKGVEPHLRMPDPFDPQEVGESTQERVLPWDSVKPLPHQRYPGVSESIDRLQQRHSLRLQQNPDLIALMDSIDKARDRKRDHLPLRESELKRLRQEEEAWQLEVENRRRAAHNQPPLNTLAELEKLNAQKSESTDPAEDPIVVESGQVLLDLLDSPQLLTKQP